MLNDYIIVLYSGLPVQFEVLCALLTEMTDDEYTLHVDFKRRVLVARAADGTEIMNATLIPRK